MREMVPKLLRLVGLRGSPGGRHLRRIIGTLVGHRLRVLPFGGSHGKETQMVIAQLTSNARMAGCPVRVLMRRQTNGGEDKEEDLRTLKEDKEEDSLVLKKDIREEVGPRKRVRRVRLMVKGRRPGGTTHRGKVFPGAHTSYYGTPPNTHHGGYGMPNTHVPPYPDVPMWVLGGVPLGGPQQYPSHYKGHDLTFEGIPMSGEEFITWRTQVQTDVVRAANLNTPGLAQEYVDVAFDVGATDTQLRDVPPQLAQLDALVASQVMKGLKTGRPAPDGKQLCKCNLSHVKAL